MLRMTGLALAAAALAALALLRTGGETAIAAEGPPRVVAATPEAAGRYLVELGGCNDCHTPRFAVTNGTEPPEREWLLGSGIGFRGPWGVSYPANLRLSVRAMAEDDWVETMRSRSALPPMPWPSLARMGEADMRAIYRYIRSLGDPGEPGPAALPPGVEPATPVFDFVPVMPRANP
jgi:mono/diheme cytochrome c family protein